MKKLIIGIILVTVLVGVFVSFRINENRNYKAKGNHLVKKIEEYRVKYKRLPKSLEEMNINTGMGEGPYYEMIDTFEYKVYFSIGFDNTLIYHSDTNEWKEIP